MNKDPEQIMETVMMMRRHLAGPHTLASVMEKFEGFKENCPKLFEMVLENKEDYMPELQKMVDHAKKVKSGNVTLEDATKVIKYGYDNKYIYPVVGGLSHGLSPSQREETEAYVRNQQREVEELEAKWARNMERQDDEEEDRDVETFVGKYHR